MEPNHIQGEVRCSKPVLVHGTARMGAKQQCLADSGMAVVGCPTATSRRSFLEIIDGR